MTPLRKLSIGDPANPYPSVGAFGPNMTGAELAFQKIMPEIRRSRWATSA